MQKGLINLSGSLLLFVYICNLVFKRHSDFASPAFFLLSVFFFSFPCRFEQWQRFWFLQCFRGLGLDQPSKDKQWKAFSPRPFIHNKHKVEAVTLTPTWKVSRAEVSIERKKLLPFGSGRVAEHIVFIYLFYFSWQGRGELSFSFFPFF